MTSGIRTGKPQQIRDVDRLNEIEDRMGQLASLLSEVAEALAEYPDGLKLRGGGLKTPSETLSDAIVVDAREWPSIEDIEKLLAAWSETRQRLASTAISAPHLRKRLRA